MTELGGVLIPRMNMVVEDAVRQDVNSLTTGFRVRWNGKYERSVAFLSQTHSQQSSCLT